MSLDATGRIVITAADVKVALDETAPKSCWLLREDGSTFTAWIPDVDPFRPPAWPRYLSTCDAVRNRVSDWGIDRTAASLTKILTRRFTQETQP